MEDWSLLVLISPFSLHLLFIILEMSVKGDTLDRNNVNSGNDPNGIFLSQSLIRLGLSCVST